MTSSIRRSIVTLVSLVSIPAVLHAGWSSDPAVNLSVADAASDQAQPKLSPTPDGGVWVSWFDGIGTGYDVRVQKLDAMGDEVLVHNGELVADRGFSSTQDYGLATEASGDALLAFRDDRFAGIQITAARIAVSGATLWGPTGVQLTSTTDFVAAPGIAGTSDGGAVVAWTQENATRVMKLDGLGFPVWPGDVVLAPGTGSYSFNDIRADGNDVIVSITHETGGFGSPRHLLAQKIGPDGSLLWGASPVAVFDGGSLQFGNFPDFVGDGAGGGVFSWYDTSTLDLQCYVQRILSDGSEAFPHDGVAVSTNTSRDRTGPSAVFDAVDGSVVVFWTEETTSTNGVYGQRVDVGGNRIWGADGVVVEALSTDDVTQVRAVQLATGTFAFWSQAPSFGTNVLLGARVDAGGTVDLMPFDVASTPSSKSRLAAVAAGDQAILAWSDDRVDSGDVLAQNVNDDGSLGDGTIAVPPASSSAAIAAWPSPARTHVHVGLPAAAGAGPLGVFDVAGRRIRELMPARGARRVTWDLTDARGVRVPAGVYFAGMPGRGSARVVVR